MLDNFRLETFVDVHCNMFEKYLSLLIGKLQEETPKYRSKEKKIMHIYKEYPNILNVLDLDRANDLYYNGVSFGELADEYYLSVYAIRKIV